MDTASPDIALRARSRSHMALASLTAEPRLHGPTGHPSQPPVANQTRFLCHRISASPPFDRLLPIPPTDPNGSATQVQFTHATRALTARLARSPPSLYGILRPFQITAAAASVLTPPPARAPSPSGSGPRFRSIGSRSRVADPHCPSQSVSVFGIFDPRREVIISAAAAAAPRRDELDGMRWRRREGAGGPQRGVSGPKSCGCG